MKNNHASDWQPGTLKTPSEYCRRTFYALSRHFPSTFSIPKQNEYYRGVQKVLARCTSSLDLHMLIVPYWYLFRTLLVPKVALGMQPSLASAPSASSFDHCNLPC